MGALLARGPTWSSHWLSSSWQPLCWQSQSPLLKLLLLQRPRLIPTFCMEATMDIHMHMEDIMDIWDMDIGAEREDLLMQNLLLNLKLIPKLILIFCMEGIMDMVMDYMEDIMDTLMLTGVDMEEWSNHYHLMKKRYEPSLN